MVAVDAGHATMDEQRDRIGTFVDVAFLTATCVIVALGEVIRLLGAGPFLLYLVLASTYCLWTKAWLRDGTALLLLVVGFGYLVLSLTGVLPRSWTEMDLTVGSTVRQSYFVVAVPVIYTAFTAMWRRAEARGRTPVLIRAFFLSASLGAVLVRAAMADMLAQSYYGELEENAGGLLALGVLNNATLVLCLALGYYSLGDRRPVWATRACGAAVAIALFAMSTGIQVQLAALALLFMTLTPRRTWRAGTAMAFIGLLAISLAGLWHVDAVYALDANTGVRLAFWRDALVAFKDSVGLGVGFGREAITNDYVFNGQEFHFDEQAFDLRYLGQHNSFLSMYFRTGLLGGTVFAWLFFRLLLRPAPPGSSWRSRWFALFLAFLGTFVNPGIESPQFVVGICLSLAFVTAGTLPTRNFFGVRHACG